MEANKQLFTEDELDILSGMFVVFVHAAERCLQLTEQHYANEYRLGGDWIKLKKKVGRQKAEEIVQRKVKDIVRGDERNDIKLLLEAAELYKMRMEKITLRGIECRQEGATEDQTFTAIQHDANFIAKVYAMMVNCKTDEDELKIVSTIKMLGKDNRCSQRLIDKFDYKVS